MSAKPDFINEKGVEWFKQTSLTKYAKEKISKNCSVWLTKFPNGKKAYLLLEGRSVIDEEFHSLEGMAFKIDKHWLLRRDDGDKQGVLSKESDDGNTNS